MFPTKIRVSSRINAGIGVQSFDLWRHEYIDLYLAVSCCSVISTATMMNTTTFERFDRDGGTRRSIYKRRYYPALRGYSGFSIRRRPGPLSQLLAFVAKKFTLCAKAYVIGPSYYVLEGILSMFVPR